MKHMRQGRKFLLGDSVAQFEAEQGAPPERRRNRLRYSGRSGRRPSDTRRAAAEAGCEVNPRHPHRQHSATACRTSMPQATARSPTTSRPA
ncbi:MAG: hypothetical protein ACLR4Z_17675 [Butyricicoccaceae bacterium]